MKRTRSHHRPKFKREAVALVMVDEYSYTVAGRSLGVKGTLIGRCTGELEGQRRMRFVVMKSVQLSSRPSMNLNQRIVGC